MKKSRISLVFIFLSIISLFSRADEGMWLPMLINKYNITTMQSMGLQLSAEQIYSVNQACLKDAVVALDHGGCTGSIISPKGLLITNHHCGYEAIAEQSSVDADYLTNGFWAMRAEEELPIPGKTVSFLVRMEDVTGRAHAEVTESMDENEREGTIEKAISEIEAEVSTDELEANVESMFEGNEYYLFVYQTFTDVRMVAAPPSAIGNFGGDTDNWMWPRHTGDFCLLRVYSSSDGKPADFSKNNIPYQPKYFLPVSLAGIKEGDFSLLLGYPGTTDRYLTSYGIEQKLTQTNPAEIKVKWTKMEVMKSFMDTDNATRIAYADKYAYLANFWKKSLQESKSLIRLKVFEDKKKQEIAFENWVSQDENRKALYSNVMSDFAEFYKSSSKTRAEEAMIYLNEILTDARILYIAFQTAELLDRFGSNDFEEMLAFHKKRVGEFYKTYNPELEKSLLINVLNVYRKNVSDQYIPDIYKTIDKKYKGNVSAYVDHMFDHSIFASEEKIMAFLENPVKKKLAKDPALKATNSFLSPYMVAAFILMSNKSKFNGARRKYMAGLLEMNPERTFYPDANSTLRLSYGTIKPYKPADALFCDYQTTTQGVLEKEDSTIQEFVVPNRLKKLIENKDFGPYATDGIMPVCFLTTHDITGGNSGSPVMNGKGELIGLAFDGNSEAMSSDIDYNVNLQRTINVDIRYVLFVIDKFAGAKYLVDEMKLVR